MHIEDWPITKVRPYANNPRVLRNAAEKVAESIKAYGWRQPIVVDESGEIIIGHSRMAAAQLLKLKTVPVHVAKGLSPEKVRALRIADNKTGEFAGWDEGKLADELAAIMESLGDVSLTGFTQAEMDGIEMRARAEIERITAAAAPAAPAIPPVSLAPTVQADPPAAEDETGSEAGQDRHQAQAPAVDAAQNEPMVPFHAMLTPDQRDQVFQALGQAKRAHNLETNGEALLVIARAYLDA